MDQPGSPEQSLRLIEGMIGQAKRSFSRMSFYFLLWGVLLTLSMLTTYLLADLSPAIRQGAFCASTTTVRGCLPRSGRSTRPRWSALAGCRR